MTSVYLGEETVHMFPYSKVIQALSLLPGQERKSISIFLHSSNMPVFDGKDSPYSRLLKNSIREVFYIVILDIPEPVLTTITSQCRLSYDEAEQLLDNVESENLNIDVPSFDNISAQICK